MNLKEVLTDLNESKMNRKIYTFANSKEAYDNRRNWYYESKRRNIIGKFMMEKRDNQVLCYYIGTDFIEPEIKKPEKPKHDTESNRFAYLDKHATKELPGTMETLRRDANKASEMHMTYGQYQAKRYMGQIR